jgi:hypothetical protein
MTHPERAARLWLAVAVATLWLLSVGGVAEETIPASTRLDVTATLARQRRSRQATRLRLVSIVRRGWITILVALLDHVPLPLGGLSPRALAHGSDERGSYSATRTGSASCCCLKNLPQKEGVEGLDVMEGH